MQKKLKVKDRILLVAAELFSRQGYTQTGINQIIAEADIAIGSLYNHFPSKNDLLLAYLQKLENEWFEGFDKFIQGIDNPKEKILKYVDFRIAHQLKTDYCGCPFIKIIAQVGAREEKVQQMVEGHKNKQKAMLYSFFKQLPNEGNLDRKMLSDNCFMMVEGAVVSTTIARNTQALENVKKFIRKTLS
ncbi:TetR/AcrR family transcriptional regulator [Chitinophaga sp. 212800010-3]|uniref:TetR/AcrR family transcriptional regulator n=1 Tax=unclassified Chitinophaga TaxID=2619133 RepID=UPI002DE3C9D2|nr:Transcriptional regulator, TetR family [Chitinophaga sp. 212800010-3]